MNVMIVTVEPFLKIYFPPALLIIAVLFFVINFPVLASEFDYSEEGNTLFEEVISSTDDPVEKLVKKKPVVKALENQAYDQYAFNKCRSLQAKPFDTKSNKKKLIIIGDSQGCDFLNGIFENGYLKNYQIQFRFIPYACQRIPNDDIKQYIRPKYQKFCLTTTRLDSLEKVKQQVSEADLVIFSALWKPVVASKLSKVFEYLKIKKSQQLVVIGYKFFGNIPIKKYTDLSNDEQRSLRNKVGKKALNINAILKNNLANYVIFANPHQLVCGNAMNCPVFTDNLKLISYDGRHLTKAGARYITKLLFQNTKLGSI
jgi:hypothetical protein